MLEMIFVVLLSAEAMWVEPVEAGADVRQAEPA